MQSETESYDSILYPRVRVLGIISGPKRDEVTGGWRILRYEELLNLGSSAYTVTQSDYQTKEDYKMGSCSEHGTDTYCTYKMLDEWLKGSGHSEYLGVGGRIILKFILRK
jgi:hypothetical protein